MNADIELINAPEGAKYVSEFMRTLPIGIFNKKNTGCGATSLMIENDQPVIICCPTQQLVNNKVAQYPNDRCGYMLLGVLEGVYESDIKAYIAECEGVQPVKIMVTYNSFGKVSNTLGDKIQDYKIIVDEYQELLDGAMYRDEVILKFLKELQGVQQVTYLSATPIPNEFIPNELIGLKQYEINWGENQVIITPHRIEVDSPLTCISNMIIEHKAGNPFKIGEQAVKEYFFFLNSVNGIKCIIKSAGLNDDNVNVICSHNAKNRETLGEIQIGNIPKENEPNKIFTFCTKTAFCGADFFSKAGLIIIVSEKHRESLYNPDFKPIEFDRFKKEAGLNAFTLSPSKWTDATNAIGIITKSGRYGGTFAHKDIAFKFASWISVEFELYIVKEFQRLKEQEQDQLGWSAKRELSKINYHIHTDAVKHNLIPDELTPQQISIVYANEADVLNVALFGVTARQWRDAYPDLKGNIRDYATINELICLSNMENINAVFINEGMIQKDRLLKLNQIAIQQMRILQEVENRKLLK